MKKLFLFLIPLCLSFVGLNAQNIFRTSMVVDTTVRAFRPEVTLSVPAEYDDEYHIFKWSTGETTPSITFLMPYEKTEYTVKIIGPHGLMTQLSILSECFLNLATWPNTICPGGIGHLVVTNNLGIPLQGGSGYSCIWNDGFEDQFSRDVSPLTTTSYSVTVTHSSGCATSMERQVIVMPALPVYIQGPDKLCAGEAATYYVTDQSGNPLSGAQYSWSTGGNQMATTIVSGNNSFALGVSVTQGGTCTSTAYKSISVSPKPSLSIETIEAPGQTIVLAHANGNFVWSTGSKDQYLKLTQPSWVMVTVTDQNGCTNSANVDVGSIFFCPPPPPPTVIYVDTCLGGGNPCSLIANINGEIQGNAEICPGTTLDLIAGSNAPAGTQLRYNWSTGEVTKKINIWESGDYVVTVTDMNLCSSVSSFWVSKKSKPEGYIDGPSIFTGDFGILTFVWTGGDEIKEYHWTPQGVENSIGPSYIIHGPGTYHLTVVGKKGCTFTYEIIVHGPTPNFVSYEEDEYVQAYPNPANNVLEVTGTSSTTELRILDFSGQVLQCCFLGKQKYTIDVVNFPAGEYIIHSSSGISVPFIVAH